MNCRRPQVLIDLNPAEATSTGMNPTLEAPDPIRSAGPNGPASPQAAPDEPVAVPEPVQVVSELMLLPDGRILAHHLTPELAALLRTALDSGDPTTHRVTPSP